MGLIFRVLRSTFPGVLRQNVTFLCVFYDLSKGFDANKSKWEQYLKKEKSLDSENALRNIVADIVKSNKEKEPYLNSNPEGDHMQVESNQDISNAKCTSYPGKVVCQIGGYTFLINDSDEKLDKDTLERFTAMVYHRMLKDDSNFEIGINPTNKEVYSFVDKSMLNQPSYIECKPLSAGSSNLGPPFHNNFGSPDTTFECEWKDNDKRMLVNVGEKGDISAGNLILPHYQREVNLLRKRKRQVSMNDPEISKDSNIINGRLKSKRACLNLNKGNQAEIEIGNANAASDEKVITSDVSSLSKVPESIELEKSVNDQKAVNGEKDVPGKEDGFKQRFVRRDVTKARIWNRLLSNKQTKPVEGSREEPLASSWDKSALRDQELPKANVQEQSAVRSLQQPADKGQPVGSGGEKLAVSDEELFCGENRPEAVDEEVEMMQGEEKKPEVIHEMVEGDQESLAEVAECGAGEPVVGSQDTECGAEQQYVADSEVAECGAEQPEVGSEDTEHGAEQPVENCEKMKGQDVEGCRAARQCCPSSSSCPKFSPACCPPQTSPICCPPQTKQPCPRCRRQDCSPQTTKSSSVQRTTLCCPTPRLPVCCPPSPPNSSCP